MKIVAPLFALLLATLATPGHAADEGTATVEALGRLNGVALACEQPALATRARNAIINNAPKTRGYGEAFENATSAAYLEQGKGAACPGTGELANQISAAEKRLQTAFPSR